MAVEYRTIADIKIGLRFRKDLGDIDSLAKSIQEIGLLSPPGVTPDGRLVYGFRRIEACKLLGWTEIPVNIIPIDDIVKGEFHENTMRKDFTWDEVIEIKRAIEPIEKAEAEKRQKAGKRLPPAKLAEGGQRRDNIAKYFHVGHTTLEHVDEIKKAAEQDPYIYGKIWQQLNNITNTKKGIVNKAYREFQNIETKQKHLAERAERLKKIEQEEKEGKRKEWPKLIPGDFRAPEIDRQIADNSVGLYLTDPPYSEQDLYLYEDAAWQATRVLMPGRSFVIYAGSYFLDKIIIMISRVPGLKYYWDPAIHYTSGGSKTAKGRRVYQHKKTLLWYIKGDKMDEIPGSDFIHDLIESEKPDKTIDEWVQSTDDPKQFIEKLTLPDDIVMDPMMGREGTTGIVARDLKRRFIGIERHEPNYKLAKSKLLPLEAELLRREKENKE